MSEGMSFSLSFHQPLLSPTGAHWLDDPSDLTCKDSIQQHSVDDPLLSCNPLPACSVWWQSVWQSTSRHQMDSLVLAGLRPLT
jgi:hypothetical protein